MIIITHIIFALIYFFLIGWIGKHSRVLGYISISMFVRKNEPIGFNFLFRVLGIAVYLILISTILYSLHLDRFVENIFMVSIYYIILKWLNPILNGWFSLVNKFKEIIYSVAIILASYYCYKYLIIEKNNILPDFSTISNELWIIIIIFLYEIFNRVQLSDKGKIKRTDNYIDKTYNRFVKMYDAIINSKLKDVRLKPLIYGIMIYENFNRGKTIRKVENLFFKIGLSKTLGVMQITSDRLINDEESIVLAIEKINQDIKDVPQYLISDRRIMLDNEAMDYILTKYNPDSDYAKNIITLAREIDTRYYQKSNLFWSD